MSGIAGIARFDGAPIEPGLVERMTGAMANRGPDGIRHWHGNGAALGQCMLSTTPEALEEIQPLTDDNQELALTMDGRVDNRDDLKRELLGRGMTLRDRSDAELVLKAYQAWGEECPKHIIGEFVFFVWDSRERRLFAARDAAGTRHFYYHAGDGWFGFASEIAGLLALERIAPRLNESRLLDYLSIEFDRDDEVGSFYQDIDRLPAGHAMRVTARGAQTWRYWHPGELPELRFGSLDECAEAFKEQLRVAVKCRLRSNGPVGAMLSGGLDSSSLVGLISKEFRGELRQPLKTYSLILEDRENCADWQGIREMMKDDWIDPTIITSTRARDTCRAYVDGIPRVNEPFELSHGLSNTLVYEAARESGCSVVLDGIASDLFFHAAPRSLGIMLRAGKFARIPALLAGCLRHGGEGELRNLAWTILEWATPEALRARYKRVRDARRPGADMNFLQQQTAYRFLAEKRLGRQRADGEGTSASEQQSHARNFTTGLLSFAHEVYGRIALSRGVEPRSPYSDRRLIEFAIRMPLEAKLYGPWHKLLLRKSMAGVIPESVRWRRNLGGHPGWKFQQELTAEMARNAGNAWDPARVNATLASWVDTASLQRAWRRYASHADDPGGYNLFRLSVLAFWLTSRQPGMARTSAG